MNLSLTPTATHVPSALLPGLADPVDDAQRIFRALLTALSRPGVPCVLSELPDAPRPLYRTAGAILLTLVDYETALWLQSPTEEITAWLRFHCSVPLADSAHEAVFAMIDRPPEMPPLSAFTQGEPEYPDRSATLIVQVPGFTPDGLRLTGPGIDGEARIGIEGLPAGFWRAWQDNLARAPLGVDLFFVSADAVVGLPRSTRVEPTTEGDAPCM